ncbi:MAG: transporter, partial [Nitrosomonadaceae bacterium]|nr:transporter [Nitrosomonadaceae bacterium]
MKQPQNWLRTLSILLILLLTACAMGPDYIRPPVDVAEKFRMEPMEGESVANLRWWELLHDETLQQLIRQALQENKNLKQAVATVEEFQ